MKKYFVMLLFCITLLGGCYYEEEVLVPLTGELNTVIKNGFTGDAVELE